MYSGRVVSPISLPSWLLARSKTPSVRDVHTPSVRDVRTRSKVVVEQIAIDDKGETVRSRFLAVVITRQTSL